MSFENDPGAPPGGYGSPPPGGYGQPPAGGYGAQPPGGYGQPPGGYGGPPGGYGGPPYGGGYPPPPGYGGYGPPPSNFLVPAIIAILCCWPLGIPAVVFAAQVNSKFNAGDVQGAVNSSARAKQFAIAAIVLGVIITTVGIIIDVAVLSHVHNATNP